MLPQHFDNVIVKCITFVYFVLNNVTIKEYQTKYKIINVSILQMFSETSNSIF